MNKNKDLIITDDRESAAKRRLRDRATFNLSLQDAQYVTKLQEFMKSKLTGKGKPFYLAAWKKVIRDIINKDGITAERMRGVVGWYIEHSEDDYTPAVYSAGQFRNKFLQIEGAMKRNPDVNQTKISKDAGKICNALTKDYIWPKSSTEMLAAAVQKSLDSYIPFWEAHRRARKNKIGNGSAKRLAGRLEDVFIFGPSLFVKNWFAEMNKRFTRRERWDGNVMKMVFTVNSSIFDELGMGHTKEYCGNTIRWKQYKEVVINEIGTN